LAEMGGAMTRLKKAVAVYRELRRCNWSRTDRFVYGSRRDRLRRRWYELRRVLARRYKRAALAVYEWIWP
jgi:hypothetical protein